MSPRFSANISLLFTEVPLLQRPAAAKAAGFDVIESWWPFSDAVPDSREVDAYVGAIADAGVRLEAMNFFGGDMAAGDRGLISVPNRAEEFADSVDVLTGVAAQTGALLFNALYGVRLEGVRPQEQDEVAVQNLALAARAVHSLGGTILLEPLARGENGTYPLETPDHVIAVIDRVRAETGAANLRLLADFYHLTRNGISWQQVIDDYMVHAGHIQIADAPGRHQPGTGSIDFPALFAALDESGYEGHVALEYRPDGPTEQSLDWLPRAARAEVSL